MNDAPSKLHVPDEAIALMIHVLNDFVCELRAINEKPPPSLMVSSILVMVFAVWKHEGLVDNDAVDGFIKDITLEEAKLLGVDGTTDPETVAFLRLVGIEA